jgi:tetratricopeptide (TPR) repeat protein
MENTAADALIDGALVHHRAGRRAEAEQGYRRALDVSPGHPDALHLLGLLWHEQRDYGRAVPQLRAAVAADPRAAEFHYGLAEALRLSGQARDAVESYGRAVALDPSLVDAWRGLGASCQLAGQPAAAANAFARAAAMDPRHAETCNNLGLALRHVGRAGEAIGWLRKAIALRPGFVEAH